MGATMKDILYQTTFSAAGRNYDYFVYTDYEIVFGLAYNGNDMWGSPNSLTCLTKNSRNPTSVFKKVIKISVNFLHNFKPPLLYFKIHEARRLNLYNRLINTYLPEGYKISDTNWNQHCYLYHVN